MKETNSYTPIKVTAEDLLGVRTDGYYFEISICGIFGPQLRQTIPIDREMIFYFLVRGITPKYTFLVFLRAISEEIEPICNDKFVSHNPTDYPFFFTTQFNMIVNSCQGLLRKTLLEEDIHRRKIK